MVGRNSILSAVDLSPRTVFGECMAVPLKLRATLAEAGQASEHVYFVEAGLLSIEIKDDQRSVGVGMIGREGIAGSWVALGRDVSPFRVVVCFAGSAIRVRAEAFRVACGRHPELRAAVLGYAYDLTAMLGDSCRAAVHTTVEARVARWLLHAHERLDGHEITITHEDLSRMLGVRRPGVTVALHVLEGEHMITAKRGVIRILDRDKLSAVSSSSRSLAFTSPLPMR